MTNPTHKATPAKNAPAAPSKPADAPKPRKRAASPVIDFGALTVADTQPVQRTSVYDTHPAREWLRDSHERGVGKSLTVSAANAKAVESAIRNVGARMNLGVAFTRAEKSGGMVELRFQAKKRKNTRKQRERDGQTAE